MSSSTDNVRIPKYADTSKYMAAGFFVTFFMFGGAGVWAAVTEIAGAVIATGTVVVESSVKKIQHQAGGIVGEIRVKNGDLVQAGDILLRLDETVTRANLELVSSQIDETEVREARFEAERDGLDAVATPETFKGREDDPTIQKILKGERNLFASRVNSRNGQKAQLGERKNQYLEQIRGLGIQIDAKAREIELIGQELASLETLEAKQLVTASKMVAMRREKARLEGDKGALISSIAETKDRINETEQQISRIDTDFQKELLAEMRDNQARANEFKQKRVAAQDQLKRVDIVAPQSGKVHQLAVHTVGGVINPGEPVMMIVPDNDNLVIDVKISPQDIERVDGAKLAMLRFTSFNSRTTPEIEGELKSVSSDRIDDKQAQESYFMGRVVVSPEQLAKLGADKKLLPGMPVDVQIATDSRSAMSYFMKPLTDQIAGAFRDR
jgi:HlyD family secretion protein